MDFLHLQNTRETKWRFPAIPPFYLAQKIKYKKLDSVHLSDGKSLHPAQLKNNVADV